MTWAKGVHSSSNLTQIPDPVLTCFSFSIPRCSHRERTGNKSSRLTQDIKSHCDEKTIKNQHKREVVSNWFFSVPPSKKKTSVQQRTLPRSARASLRSAKEPPHFFWWFFLRACTSHCLFWGVVLFKSVHARQGQLAKLKEAPRVTRPMRPRVNRTLRGLKVKKFRP